MTISQSQKWLTLGFGMGLATLLGTGLIAYEAIINREYPFEVEAEADSGYALLNEILAAIAGAEVSHQAYLETGEEENQRESYVYLEIAESFLEELNAEEEENDYWLYLEALEPLKTALENRVSGLAASINQSDAEPPGLQTQIDRAAQRSQAQLEIHMAVQTLVEEGFGRWE